MTETIIVYTIRQTPKLRKRFDRMTTDQKRRLLDELDGDIWHIDEIMDEILEDKSE